jgi:hypothetical protein
MLISFVYRLTRKILNAVATIAPRDASSDAELLVLLPREHGAARSDPAAPVGRGLPGDPGRPVGVASQADRSQVHHHAA